VGTTSVGTFILGGLSSGVKILGWIFIGCIWQWWSSGHYFVENVIWELHLALGWKPMLRAYGGIGPRQRLCTISFMEASLLKNYKCSSGVVIGGGRFLLLRLVEHSWGAVFSFTFYFFPFGCVHPCCLD
jgi:hypothetical protein